MELNFDENVEIERVNELIADASYELDSIDPDYIEWLLSAWICDDQGNAGIALQLAAAAEFGCDVPEHLANGRHGISDVSDAQAVLRWLKARRPAREMVVYRGISGREGLPLESWTEDREIAEFYAKRNGSGIVVERTVSADEILTTWRSGLGLKCAEEVIVINRRKS